MAALTNLQYLYLNNTDVSELTPVSMLTGLKRLYLKKSQAIDLSPIAALNRLEGLYLNQTRVRDLSPIVSLTDLQWLYLHQTDVSDLSPILNLTKLQWLHLSLSKVRDLRPLISLPVLNSAATCRIQFSNTPATKYDRTLHRLSQIKDDTQRKQETLAYLKTLPPWPEPLPWLTAGSAPPESHEPSRQGEPFLPAIPLPAGLRRITLAEARHILVSGRPQLRARCQHVVAELDDALAMQAVRIPNEPDQLAAHTAIINSLTLAKAALMGLHDALPEDDLDRPVTEAEVTTLRTAFDALLDKLKSAAAYVDRTDHTPTYGGLLKLGCATGIASVLCLFPGLAMTAAIPGVYAMLYGGPAAIKTLGELGKKAGGA